jgi:transcriptional regulator with XRE-family HTH domain
MARSATYSDSRLARVCRYYSLTRRELAALLGVSPGLVSQLESGARALTRDVSARLAPFLASLEAEEAAAPPTTADAPPPGAFVAGPLEKRRAACLHEAHNLRWQLRALPEEAAVAARWAAALPALLDTLPPPPADEAPATREAVRLRYVHSWLATVPLALPPEALAEWHLRHQRARALEAEAAALGKLLGVG